MHINNDKNSYRTTLWEVNQRILASCAYRKLPEDNNWLRRFSQRTKATIMNDSNTLAQWTIPTKAAFEMVDYAIDCLAHYAVKFNQCSVMGIKVSVTNPALVSELAGQTNRQTSLLQASYRGRLTSNDWSLVVRSRENTVEFLLVPATKILNLSYRQHEFDPFIVLKPVHENQQIRWQYNDEFYTQSELGHVFQDSFKQFIDKIYEEMDKDASRRKSGVSKGGLAEIISNKESDCNSDLSDLKPTVQESFLSGGEIMQRTDELINRLMEEESKALQCILNSGAMAFERSDFEKVEELLKLASLRKKSNELVSALFLQWEELADVDDLIESTELSGCTLQEANINESMSSAEQLRLHMDCLIANLLKVGSTAFADMKLDLVQTVCKKVLELKSFQKRFHELYGEDSTEKKSSKLLAAVA